jgi:zinc/manganese transport system substrate-binding protein
MVKASLAITNGLGLEEGLTSALATAKEDGATIYEVGPALDPQPLAGTSGSPDPHVWMDVSRMANAATLIGQELATVTGDAEYTECGTQVSATLMDTDSTVRAVLETVPESSRILVTDHDAFGCRAFLLAGARRPGVAAVVAGDADEVAGREVLAVAAEADVHGCESRVPGQRAEVPGVEVLHLD